MGGALLNYDLYTNHTEHIGGQASLWHEFRYFNENGSFSSTGYARENFTGNDGQQEGYVRYDTTLLFTNEDDAMSWSVGDVISDALSWSSSVRMGGISVGRDFSLRPDLVTWPLPEFAGKRRYPPRSISLSTAIAPAQPSFSRALHPDQSALYQRRRGCGTGHDGCAGAPGQHHAAVLRHQRPAQTRAERRRRDAGQPAA
jgi:outer membrane usher protein